MKLFEYHKPGSLALWRWGSLVDVCDAFHKLEGALRMHWNMQKFLSVRDEEVPRPDISSLGQIGQSEAIIFGAI